MNEQSKVRVIIPFGNGGKVELEGDFDSVKTDVEKVDQLFEKLNAAIGQMIAVQKEPQITLSNIPGTSTSGETPIIPTEEKRSPSRAIAFLVESPWGQRGRQQSEINAALETNMVYKSTNFISATLSNMTKANKIARRKEGDSWKYYPTLG